MKKGIVTIVYLLCFILATVAEDSITILQKANTYMQAPIPVVTEKVKRFSNNKHNYESLSTYFWENPEDVNGSWIYRDGERNPERLKFDGDKINQLSYHCKYFSQAYSLTHDEQFKKRYNQEVYYWFLRPSTKMLPNMEYAQIVVNRDNNLGTYIGIIDGYVLIDVVNSIDLMRQEKAINTIRYRQLQRWFRQFSEWLLTSENGKKQAAAANNLSIAYDVMLCRFMLFTGDIEGMHRIGREFLQRRVLQQIAPDGSQPIEERRAQPIHYSLYNLQHIYDMCALQQQTGLDIYPECREHVEMAIRYLEKTLSDPSLVVPFERKDISYRIRQLQQLKQDFHSL